MNKAGLNHRMDIDDVYSIGKGLMVFRLRTAKSDIARATIHYTDKFLHIHGYSDIEEAPMVKVGTAGEHDYFEVEMNLDVIALRYFFEVEDHEGQVAYLGDNGVMDRVVTETSKMFDIPQQAREEEQFLLPEWMENAVVYQIFPERFYKGADRLMDDSYDPWDMDVKWNSNLGGSINGIREKMTYIKELGVTVIYLNPVFLAPSNHKYDTTDYFEIDPSFGTKEEFKLLVEEIHELGMHIVIDGVFNHCGYHFFAFQDVIRKEKESRYVDWFHIYEFPIKYGRDEQGHPIRPTYETFGYFGGMPKLNMGNPEVREYIFKLTDYWTREFGIDGWRLDASDEISFDFWRAFRRHIKDLSPHIGLIGEIWYDASAWLRGDQYDSVMNYKFRTPVVDFIAKGKMDASEFGTEIQYSRCRYKKPTQRGLWNLIGSHDTERFLTLCDEDKRKLKLAVMLQMSIEGSPVIYYGDEVGMTGGRDPGCRKGMIWGEDLQDREMLAFYKDLIRTYKREAVLRTGDFHLMHTDDQKGLLVYQKLSGEEKIVVAINNGGGIVDMEDEWFEGENLKILVGESTKKLNPYEGCMVKIG